MPKINFDQIGDIDDFTPLEEDTYLCRLAEVEEATTQFGDELWKLRWVVAEGPYQGRFIFDNMVFSEAALKRVKLICSCLGLEVSGEVDITPELIKGRMCYVTVEVEEEEVEEGKIKSRNVVPFAGYAPADKEGSNGEDDDENLPF